MKKLSILLAVIACFITSLSIFGVIFRSHFEGSNCFPICIVKPAPSLDGMLVNLMFQPLTIVFGLVLLVSSVYLSKKK